MPITTNDIILRADTSLDIILGNAVAHNGTVADVNNIGDVNVEMNIASLVSGAARQSAKFDFGIVRADFYKIIAIIEWATAPIPSEVLDFFLAFSNLSEPSDGNPGGVSGIDSAFDGYSSNLDESLKQLDFMGPFVATPQATPVVQKSEVGIFSPPTRWGSLVIDNNTSDDLHNDMVEMSVLITPAILRVQP